jgi:hypothetical protein
MELGSITKNDIVVDCLELAFAIYISLFANSFYINNTRRMFAKGFNSNPSRRAVYVGGGGRGGHSALCVGADDVKNVFYVYR